MSQLGIAEGIIRIKTDDLLRAETAIINFSRRSNQSMQSVAQGIDTATTGMGLFQAAFAVAGVVAEQNIKRVDLLFKTLAGGAEQANKYRAELEEMAKRTGQPFMDLMEGSLSLLPVVARTNASLKETLGIAQRLAVLDPMQGTRGASLAIREFLSGDAISLAKRFELNRNELKAILDENEGDIGGMVDGLSELLDKTGLTQESMEEMGRQGLYTFDVLRSEAQRALAEGLEPMVEQGLLPLASGLADVLTGLRETNPELLQMLTSLLAISSVSGALRRVGFGTAGQFIGLAGSTFAGVQLGVQGAAALGVGGTNDPDEQATRLKQVIFTALALVTEPFFVGASLIKNGVDVIVTAIDLIGTSIAKGASDLSIGFIQAIQDIGKQFKIPLLEQFGGDIEQMRQDSRSRWVNTNGSVLTAPGLVKGSAAQQDTAAALGEGWTFVEGYAERIERLNEALKNPPDAESIVADGVAMADRFLNAVLDVMFPGRIPQQVTEEAEALQTASERFLSALEGVANSNAWADITKAVEEFADTLKSENTERVIDASREGEDFSRGRLRALADERKARERIDAQNLAREGQAIAQMEKLRDDGNAEELDATKKAYDDRQKLLREHNKALKEIQENAHYALLDAIGAGDSAAAINAVRNAERQTRKENEEYTERDQERQTELNKQLEAMHMRRDIRLAEAQAQLDEMRAQFIQQRKERDEDFELRLDREDEDRAIRLSREQEDFERRRTAEQEAHDRQMSDLYTQLWEETAFDDAVIAEVSRLVGTIRDSVRNVFAGIQSEAASARSNGGLGGIVQGAVGWGSQVLQNIGQAVGQQERDRQAAEALAWQQWNARNGGGAAQRYTPTPFANEGMTRFGGIALLHPNEGVFRLPPPADRQSLPDSLRPSGKGTTLMFQIDARGSKMEEQDFRRIVVEEVEPRLDEREIRIVTNLANMEREA